MGNNKTKSSKKKIIIYFISGIATLVVVFFLLSLATRKSALEKCADAGQIYVWGEQNKAYNNRSLKVKMNDTKTFKDFPYVKLFEICTESQKQFPDKFQSQWGK